MPNFKQIFQPDTHVRIGSALVASENGFTLIELIIIIVVIGILGGVAIPKYQDLTAAAKEVEARKALYSMREGLNLWRSNKIISTGNTSWPAIDTLRLVGGVMLQDIPANPYQLDSNAPDSIVTGVTRGVVVGTRGGWAYKASTGELWPNTSSSVTVTGCGSPVAVGENQW